MGGGLVLLAIFAVIETRDRGSDVPARPVPIRAFTAGNIATLLASLGRGGLMFMLIMWLQGIWLPLHGYSFSQTPLWAGIYMLPLTVGFLIAGPASGYLSDHFGARPFATGGMLVAALALLPARAPAGRLQLRLVQPPAAAGRASGWGSSPRRTRPGS